MQMVCPWTKKTVSKEAKLSDVKPGVTATISQTKTDKGLLVATGITLGAHDEPGETHQETLKLLLAGK